MFAVVQRVPGVDLVEMIGLYPAEASTGERGKAEQRIDLEPDNPVYSYGHVVRVRNR